ncbi:MAG: cytochrome c oxidase subunit II [Synechococcus sp.]
MLTRRQIAWLVGLAIANLLVSLWMGQQAYKWMPAQASAEAVLVDRLFSFFTTVGTFIFLGVVGTLLYSMIFQRAAKYDASDGPAIEGNVTLEVVWTTIPILLVIWIATASYQTYHQMDILGPITPQASTESAITPVSATSPAETQPIEVRARQWSWVFYYPDSGITSTELHLPVNQRAHFKLTSDDVLHGLFVPAFRVKQDIVPGKVIDFACTPTQVGRYPLRDSEYSGTYFAANQAYVVVETAEDYQQWLASAAQTSPTPAPNRASEEFDTASQQTTGLRWSTVTPAPPPVVNYSAS